MNFVWQPSSKHSSSINGYFYVTQGGMVMGGSPPYSRGRAWLPTGGMVMGGTAEVETSADPRTYEYTMTGGYEMGGTFPVVGHHWEEVNVPEASTIWNDVEGF